MCVTAEPELIRVIGANAAIVYSQIAYWLTKAANGKSKFVVKRDGHTWVAKSRSDLCHEIGLTQQQLRIALKRLKDEGVIISERHLFDNKVTAHVRLPFHKSDQGQPTLTGTGAST